MAIPGSKSVFSLLQLSRRVRRGAEGAWDLGHYFSLALLSFNENNIPIRMDMTRRRYFNQLDLEVGVSFLVFISFPVAEENSEWDSAEILSDTDSWISAVLCLDWRMREADFRPLIVTSPSGWIWIIPAPSSKSK